MITAERETVYLEVEEQNITTYQMLKLRCNRRRVNI